MEMIFCARRFPAVGMLLSLGLILLQPPVVSSAASGVPGSWNVRDFGARGDGKTLDTQSVNAAVRACSGAGGGTVFVPAGTYLTGTIELLSHVTLYLEAGATLLGSPDVRQYALPGQEGRPAFSSGAKDTASVGLITARNASHVAITGEGVIDGNGTRFADNQTIHGTGDFDEKYTRQGIGFLEKTRQIVDGPVETLDRPERLILFSGCRYVRIQDVTLQDAPCWTVHLDRCEFADLSGVRIHNNLLIPNNDGIHCTTSRFVHIENCDIQAGDDAIIVSGLGAEKGEAGNVTVNNCTLLSRSSGIRIGYGISDIRNCLFQNLVIHGSNRGIGLFVRQRASIRNIAFSNIILQTRLMAGHWWGKGEPIHLSVVPMKEGDPTGTIENVRFSNVSADSEAGIVMYGDRQGDIRDVSIRGLRLHFRNSPLNSLYGGNFDLRPAPSLATALFRHDIPAFYARGVEGLSIHELDLRWDAVMPDFVQHGLFCEKFRDLEVDGFSGRQPQPSGTGAAIALQEGHGLVLRNSRAEDGTGVFLSILRVNGPRFLSGNDLSRAQKAWDGEIADLKQSANYLPGE